VQPYHPALHVIERIVTRERAGSRLDRFLALELPEFSRARLQTLIRDGYVRLNGRTPRPRDVVRSGDAVEVKEPAVTAIDAQPESIPLEILNEDDDLIVINKPAGLVIHPGAGNQEHTLVNALLAHCTNLSGIAGRERPGIVHRLDKETSGCVVVAKNDAAHRSLSDQFAKRSVQKIYLALVAGELRKRAGIINEPIARHRVHRQKMSVARSGGRVARTDFRVLTSGDGISVVECTLHSGRTHQIRVHMHHIGHPVLGDKVYGSARRGVYSRHMLHAWKLGFTHPRSGSWSLYEAPLPADFNDVTSRLPALTR
jgi:23S rRNA pseudouridine1911/1915/1917 synthase